MIRLFLNGIITTRVEMKSALLSFGFFRTVRLFINGIITPIVEMKSALHKLDFLELLTRSVEICFTYNGNVKAR